MLYRLFEWPKKQGSNLILIGIANEMDLTDRFLPRLRSRDCEPELLIFSPYKQEQLQQLSSLSPFEAADKLQEIVLNQSSNEIK